MIGRSALLVVLLIVLTPVHALAGPSDEARDLLGHAPRSALADGPVSYVDYRTVESTRPGAAQPDSTAEWIALRERGEAPFGLWLAAIRGIGGGSGRFLDAFVMAADEQPGLMGFDFFDVDRELHFGSPPTDGLVLAGTFDPAAIAAAHEARGFTTTEVPGWMLICGAAGCDQGTVADLQASEPADPFGGFLGRRQPLLASDRVLLSSAALGTLEGLRATSDGSTPSMADDDAVQTALDALPPEAQLRQAMLLRSELLPGREADTPMAEDAGGSAAGAGITELPPYDLVLLADTVAGNEQVTHVILTYGSELEAADAATALPGRVEAGRSSRTERTLPQLLDDRGVTAVSSDVHVRPDGSGAAAVLTLRAPLASADLSATPIEASSLPYRLLIDMIESADASWLDPAWPSRPGDASG